jgi:ornithine cyclodeaminase/alanine dehydrogenase-like protein (mu-crystallin family)
MALFLREDDVARLLPMREALEAVEEVFRLHGSGGAVNQARSRVRLPGSVLHVMSGGVIDLNVVGLKAYTTTRQGARFVVLLFQADTGVLLAVMEADRLGQTRTGAASGVATKYMARIDARAVGLIGTGWQARAQLAAVCSVRSITEVKAYSRHEERRRQFCAEMSAELGVPVTPAGSAEEAAREADIVVTITNAREPVLYGAWLKPGAHVNAAGSNALIRCEIDEETVRRARLIAVDAKDQARIECGDLLGPVERGIIHWDQVRELGEVVAGRIPGRTSAEDITLFESQGLAIEDVAVAARVYARAREAGVGEDRGI